VAFSIQWLYLTGHLERKKFTIISALIHRENVRNDITMVSKSVKIWWGQHGSLRENLKAKTYPVMKIFSNLYSHYTYP